MNAGAWMMVFVFVVTIGTLGLILFSTFRSIRNERSAHRSVWREFGLGLCFLILFFTTWVAHLIASWQVFTDEATSSGEPTKVGNFIAEFAQGTLENWQSEFLQLFSFVVMAALFIHKGSAESKDGEENIAASLRRIEEHLGILPGSAPTSPGEQWKLPETPLEMEDAVRAPAGRER
ncbi:MAG: hypothetical protein HZB15_02165 [Actinobacteria bacterium]|nr:hypothetical protein [Actinomycetota bacterium]